jgi:predicted transcriptional regulator
MKIPSHEEFNEYVQTHLDKSGEKPSAFGRRVLGDSGAITRLMEGTDPRLSTMQKIDRAIKDK